MGGGDVPEYHECFGCIIQEAQECVYNMRRNFSGNVHPSCPFPSLSLGDLSSCCPIYRHNDPSNPVNVLPAGAAYPDAIKCLEFVGCQDTYVFKDLIEECESNCPTNPFDCRGFFVPIFSLSKYS